MGDFNQEKYQRYVIAYTILKGQQYLPLYNNSNLRVVCKAYTICKNFSIHRQLKDTDAFNDTGVMRLFEAKKKTFMDPERRWK